VPYEVDSNGEESRVNKHYDGNTMIIERMLPKFVLRRGKFVVEVVNSAVAKGRDNKSGTVSPDVEVVVKEPKE
jgi:hypothetical protein